MLSENLTSAEICPQNLGGTERQLRNSDLSMTYWIMLAGFCTAAVIFFTEVLHLYIFSEYSYNVSILHENSSFLYRSIIFNLIFIHQIIFKCVNRRFNLDRNKVQNSSLRINPQTKKQTKNVTPPPAYGTLFNRNKIFTTEDYVKPFDPETGVKKIINGRSYMVYRNSDGDPRLVPIRTPSAALFQYTYTK